MNQISELNKMYEIQVEIEKRCMLSCLHCSSKKLRVTNNTGFDFDIFIDFLLGLNSKIFLYFTGGEPLLHQDLWLKFFKVKKIVPYVSLGFFTCGVTNHQKPVSYSLACSLKASGLDECYISLYHYDPDIHDKITCFQNSYIVARESIKNFLAAGIKVNAHVVLTRLNFKEIESVIHYILSIGVSSVRVLRIVKTGSAFDNWDEIGISYDVQNEIANNLISDISSYSSRLTISGFPERLACRPLQGSTKCQAGTGLLYITSDGDVYPCACTKGNNNFLLGNLCDKNLSSLIRTRYADKIFNESCLNPISF